MTKIQPFRLFVFYYQNILTMSKSTHFSGHPMYGQLIDLLDKRKVLDYSRTIGSERYVKSFDAWQHLLVMLYAVSRGWILCEKYKHQFETLTRNGVTYVTKMKKNLKYTVQ